MKIHHLLDGINVAITNEENNFIRSHPDHMSLLSLNERDLWLAQNLVRKNIYRITNDNRNIVINKGYDQTNKSSI